MPGDDGDSVLPCPQVFLQLFEAFDGHSVALRQCTDEAVAAIRAEPDRVAGEQVFIVDEIDHVAPGMSWHKYTFHLDTLDIEDLPVVKQHTAIVALHHRQPVQVIDHPPPRLAG